MAKVNPGSSNDSLGYNSLRSVPGNIDVGEELAESMDLARYDRAELYTVMGEAAGSSEVYVLDPTVNHGEAAIREFAELFPNSDLLVPSSKYTDVAWFIPNEEFKADEDLESCWGYVEDKRDKYILISKKANQNNL